MSSINIAGNVSGTVSLSAPDVAGTTVLTLPATSGTVLTTTGGVAPGTSGNVLTSNGTTWTSAALPATGIGSGQTWSDQSGNRTNNVQYTNSTGKPIMVGLGYGRNAQCQVYVGGVYIAGLYHDGNNNNAAYYSFIVPIGSTYQVNSTNWSLDSGAFKWGELR